MDNEHTLYFSWDQDKNALLKSLREVSFEMVVQNILSDDILDIIMHPNQKKYPGQKILFTKLNDYVHAVPYVENNNEIFLKTIFPDRNANKKYQNI